MDETGIKMGVSVEEQVNTLLKLILELDYDQNPKEAFIKLRHYNHQIKTLIGPYRKLKSGEEEIDSVNLCIDQMFGFKNQVFDAYHHSNFNSHRRRMQQACHEISVGINDLNKRPLE